MAFPFALGIDDDPRHECGGFGQVSSPFWSPELARNLNDTPSVNLHRLRAPYPIRAPRLEE